MALIDELSDALKEAMKAKDKPKLDAIRQVQTEIAKKKSEKGEEATDELVLGVISSYVKKMTKAVEEYKSLGDRGTEMADKIQFEIDFLSGWLPEQLSEEDVAKLVDEVLADLGEVDMSQMGRIIGAVMAKGEGIDSPFNLTEEEYGRIQRAGAMGIAGGFTVSPLSAINVREEASDYTTKDEPDKVVGTAICLTREWSDSKPKSPHLGP